MRLKSLAVHFPSAAVLGTVVTLWTTALTVPADAAAQRPSELVDGIVAVVDDTAVLFSELQEYVYRLQINEGMRVPEDPRQRREFYRQALEQKVNEVLLYVHANREGITVPQPQVEDAVEQRITQIKRQFNSELEFQQALAAQQLTEAEFRLQLTEQARTALTSRTYLQQKVSGVQPIPVSDQEVEDAFEAQRRSLGPKPATVTLKQVILKPQPTEEARTAAEDKAEQALSRARAGEDFARLAREYSEDVASRSDGGSLGWVQRGQLLPEFEDALFAMRPGQISDIVRTSVGLHIIKLERVRGNERQARHILIRPEITDDDVARARNLAGELVQSLRAGADIDSLIDLYHNPSEASSLTGFAIDRLPPDFRSAIEGTAAGDIVGPIELAAPGPLPTQFAVVEILQRNEGGDWTLDDVRDRFRQQIQENKMIERVVQDLRESTYIDVREQMLDALAAFPTG